MNKKTLITFVIVVGLVAIAIIISPPLFTNEIKELTQCGDVEPVYCAKYRCETGFSSEPGLPGGRPRCNDDTYSIDLGEVSRP